MPIDPNALLALKIQASTCTYGPDNTILYALSTGFGSDPTDPHELRFVHEDQLQASPTMATVIGWDRSWIPRTGIHWPLVMHGDQTLRIHHQIPPAATVTTEAHVSELLDKGPGKGALLRIETRAYCAESKTHLWTTSTGFFARKHGGFSNQVAPASVAHPVPERPADYQETVHTLPHQALLYRLNGDKNPLHARPEAAKIAGFSTPVLHGLCVYGFACRSILRNICFFDPHRLIEIDARFTAPAFPGDTLHIALWKDDTTVSFRVYCPERNTIIIDNGRALVI